MDDQLDNELKNRIKEVFDNFEDTAADEGWLLLREKFPEKEKDRKVFAWIWWGATAAILLVFLGIGIWLQTGKSGIKKVSYANVEHYKSASGVTGHEQTGKKKIDSTRQIVSMGAQNTTNTQVAETTGKEGIGKKQFDSTRQIVPAGAQSTINTQVAKATGKEGIGKKQFDTSRRIVPAGAQSTVNSQVAKATGPQIEKKQFNTGRQITPVTSPNVTNTLADNDGVAAKNTTRLKQKGIKNSGDAKGVKGSMSLSKDSSGEQSFAAGKTPDHSKDDVSDKQTQQVAVNDNKLNATTPGTPAPPSVVIKQKPAKTINDMFAEDANKKTDKKNDKSDKQDKKVHFGVYAATYFNYAKGSNNEVNAGAGFTSDINLTRNLRLETGVAINQNSLSYGGSSQPVDAENNLVLAGSSVYYGPAAANGANATSASSASIAASSNYLNSVASVKSYNANLVGLDIPLNLKYEFNPQRNNFYVVGGFSSGTFINEAYTYNYSSGLYPQQTGAQTTNKSFDNFYFAKTLNLAFGVGYPLGKNSLVIEPFLKYPLQGLGAEQIKFGAGGINLKLNFSSKK